MSDFQWRSLTAHARQQMGQTPIYAVLGDDSDPSQVFDITIPGNVWARVMYANGYGRAISVRGPIGTSVKLKPGTAVELVPTADGRLAVRNYDTVGAVQSGTNPLAQNMPEANSGRFIGQQSLITALVTPQQVPDLTIAIRAWPIITSGILTVYPGSPQGGVDLSSYVPSSGNQRYVVVFLDSDFASSRVTGSTARLIADVDLNTDDIQECLTAAPASSIPLAAIRLYGGQTAITNADVKHDLRQLINTTGQNDVVSYSNILTDNSGDVLSDNNGDVLFA